ATVQDFDQWRTGQEESLRNPLANVTLGTSATPAANAQGQSLTGAILGGANSSADSVTAEQNTAQSLASRSINRTNISGQAGAAVVSSPPSGAPAPNFLSQTTTPGTFEQNREASTMVQMAQQLGVDPLVLTNFLTDSQVAIEGAVRGPGLYFIGTNVTLQDLVMAAGGTKNWADASGVEVISTNVEPGSGRSVTQVSRLSLTSATLANYIVKPHDTFHFNQVFTDVDIGTATLQGEVRFAGAYRLTRGEHLSDLLARAGGLTSAAYPYGTIFLRRSAAAVEQEGYSRTARQIEDQLLLSMTRAGNNRLDPSSFAALQSFVSELRSQKALGRIAIQADPGILAANPGLDPILETGDVIYIPPRPAVVSVLGQVMQPGNFPYMSGASVGDYIQRAGGYNSLADESDAFVVLPDGSARKLERSWLRFSSVNALPPGSTIVVPRDISPLDLRQTIVDITQILSQLAVTVASVAVLSK
ncbi:MAG: SLBB domain-containing protein, partial [Alphaproteobacteria bacterium]|nr:SLBB domain-containing protein [Alphaproteobacteria bacterium]